MGLREDHFLWELHVPTLLCPGSWDHRLGPVGGDILWSLCSCLQTLALLCSHEFSLFHLLAEASWVSGLTNSTSCPPYILGPPVWILPNGPHLLWSSCTAQISCVDIHANEMTLLVTSSIFVLVPLILMFISHGAVVQAVLRMQSTTGFQKAFGTDMWSPSHSCLSFIPDMCIYLQPAKESETMPNSSPSSTVLSHPASTLSSTPSETKMSEG